MINTQETQTAADTLPKSSGSVKKSLVEHAGLLLAATLKQFKSQPFCQKLTFFDIV